MQALHIQTPLVRSWELEEKVGIPVWLKLESLQPSGSFKNRGLCHMVATFAQKGARRFIAASGGNAGLAVAYAGHQLGVSVKVIVPTATSREVKERLRILKASVVVHGENFDDAAQLAQELAKREEAIFVPPFDHPLIWEGHRTLIDEVAATGVRPGAVLLSVGGGGLMIGTLQGMHHYGWTDVPLIAAEAAGAPTLASAMKAQRLVRLEKVDSVAHSLAARVVASEALEWTHRHRVVSEVVSERATVEAVVAFANDCRLLVEPACGACLAVLYEKRPVLEGLSSILVIICGGAGVSLSLIEEWKRRVGIE